MGLKYFISSRFSPKKNPAAAKSQGGERSVHVAQEGRKHYRP
jgi:hypothetical protein